MWRSLMVKNQLQRITIWRFKSCRNYNDRQKKTGVIIVFIRSD